MSFKIEDLTLWKKPITTLNYFFLELYHNVKTFFHLILNNTTYIFYILSILIISLFYVVSHFFEGQHQETLKQTDKVLQIAGWWVGLGILSSVGLGTGLHTFVLYLGPFIATVAMTSTECNSFDFNKYDDPTFVCLSENKGNHEISFLSIFTLVQYEAILWGIGTALGELPPYLIARAASQSGESIEELEILGDVNSNTKLSPSSSLSSSTDSQPTSQSSYENMIIALKKVAFRLLGRYRFIGILLFASIPNPLFDLAGLICGHFRVPFWQFFIPTAIGKAFIKAQSQAIFVVAMFRKEQLDTFVGWTEKMFPFIGRKLSVFLENERSKFHKPPDSTHEGNQSNIFKKVWDVILLVMILFFVVSIINSMAQSYYHRFHNNDKKNEKHD